MMTKFVFMAFITAKELFPVQIAGTSVGAVNLFPFLGGAVFIPLLGRVLDVFPKTQSGGYSLEGYQMMFLILLISSIASLICTFPDERDVSEIKKATLMRPFLFLIRAR